MLKLSLVALGALAIAAPVSAQAVRSTVTAANGIEVTVFSDEFANRYEYSAPKIDLEDGFALVSRVDRGEVKGPVYLGGSFVYSGDWRYYTSALFRGGDEAEFTSTGRNVGSCRAARSRYGSSSCTLTEGFRIDFTAEDVATHAQDGTIAIQIRATRSASNAMVQIPATYIEAVREVASRPRP